MASITAPQQLISDNSRTVSSRNTIQIVDCRQKLASSLQHRLAKGFKTQVGTKFQAGSVVIISPLVEQEWRWGGPRLSPSEAHLATQLERALESQVKRVVLISSSEVYGADYRHPGMVNEDRSLIQKRTNRVTDSWIKMEALATRMLAGSKVELTIVRPCYLLKADSRDFFERLFRRRCVFTFAGYDPSIQCLTMDDFVEALARVVERGIIGTINIAPPRAITLRDALRVGRVWRIPIPHLCQRPIRAILARLGLAEPLHKMEFLRFPCTISANRLIRLTGFQPLSNCAQAIARLSGRPMDVSLVEDDEYGMSPNYIRSCSRWQFKFLEKFYWRVEAEGLENIPTKGGAVMAGLHRGFMPFDGVMMVHLLSERIGRIPRFLIHYGLVKHPHLSGFLTRLGGVLACQENADRILDCQQILGVFPEGIRGAFRMYDRNVYKIGKHRSDYIATAVRHGVPIIPFVCIGPAESFPILGKVEWAWWKQHLHWPFIPITPTANLIPLPTKWHIKILPAIETAGLANSEDIDSVTRKLNRQVLESMQTAIAEMLEKRRSIFWGSIFDKNLAMGEVLSTKIVA